MDVLKNKNRNDLCILGNQSEWWTEAENQHSQSIILQC